MVERLVANEKVVGSSPIARSNFIEYILMIIWIASYPKSGNTYIRSFIASYYFSKKGKFDLITLFLERAKGVEPSTFSLATRRSTTELCPLVL